MNHLEKKIGKVEIWPAYIKRAFKSASFEMYDQLIVTTFAYLNNATALELESALLDIGISPEKLNYTRTLWKRLDTNDSCDKWYSFHVDSNKMLYVKTRLPKDNFEVLS